MTREEALKLWLPIVVMGVRKMPEIKEALNMAIEALEAESESRMSFVQEAVNAIMNTCNTDSITDKAMRNAAKFVQNAIDGSYPEFEKLEQEPCGDAISRQAVLDINEHYHGQMPSHVNHEIWKEINALPPVTPQPKMGHCKDCKYFEYDSVAKVNGIPLIVAHEICKRWGDGCKSSEDGYCFLFEPKMQEVEE